MAPEGAEPAKCPERLPWHTIAWDAVSVLLFLHGMWAVIRMDEALAGQLEGPLQCNVLDPTGTGKLFEQLCASHSNTVPEHVLYQELWEFEGSVIGGYINLAFVVLFVLILALVELVSAHWARKHGSAKAHDLLDKLHRMLGPLITILGTAMLSYRAAKICSYDSLLNKLEVFGLWEDVGSYQMSELIVNRSLPRLSPDSTWNLWSESVLRADPWSVFNKATGINVTGTVGSQVGIDAAMAMLNLHGNIVRAQVFINLRMVGDVQNQLVFFVPMAWLTANVYSPQLSAAAILKETQRQWVQRAVFDEPRDSVNAAKNSYWWASIFVWTGMLALCIVSLALRRVRLKRLLCFPKSCNFLAFLCGPALCSMGLVLLGMCTLDAGYSESSLGPREALSGKMAFGALYGYFGRTLFCGCVCSICACLFHNPHAVREGLKELKDYHGTIAKDKSRVLTRKPSFAQSILSPGTGMASSNEANRIPDWSELFTEKDPKRAAAKPAVFKAKRDTFVNFTVTYFHIDESGPSGLHTNHCRVELHYGSTVIENLEYEDAWQAPHSPLKLLQGTGLAAAVLQGGIAVGRTQPLLVEDVELNGNGQWGGYLTITQEGEDGKTIGEIYCIVDVREYKMAEPSEG